MRLFVGTLLAAAITIPSQMTFKADGTGSISRKISSKLGDVVSVLDFTGVDITGATDSTAGIQSAATAMAAGGTLYFPAGTYKINSAVTIAIGVNLRGSGAILDLTSNTTKAFDYNSGAVSFSFTALPTLVQGFRVNGTVTNTSTYLVKSTRMPYLTIRDVTAYKVNVLDASGEAILNRIENVIAYQPVGEVFRFLLGTGGFGANGTSLDHVYVEAAQNGSATGVRVDSGDILISNSYFEELAQMIWINGGAATVSNSSFNTRSINGQVMFYITAIQKDPALTVTGSYMSFGEATSVANQQNGVICTVACGVVFAGNEFSAISSVAAPVTVFKSTSPNGQISGTVTGNRFYVNAQSATQTMSVMDPTTVTNGFIYMEFAGNTFWADAGAPQPTIDLTLAGATGTIAQTVFTGNNFLRSGNLLRLTNGKVAGNNFQGAATTIAWVVANGGSLTDNIFGNAPTITNPLAANNNLGYGTTVGALSHGIAALAYSATIATDASAGDIWRITATNGTAFTISSPTNPGTGQRLTYVIRNTSGGAHGLITWGAAFKTAAAALTVTTAFSKSIEFVYDGTNWIELFRSAADVAN